MSVVDKIKAAPTENLFSDIPEYYRTFSRIRAKVAHNIRVKRKELGLSQAELADMLDVTQAAVSQWESGECNLTLETLCKIFTTLKVDPDMIFNDTINKKDIAVSIDSLEFNGITTYFILDKPVSSAFSYAKESYGPEYNN